MMKVGVVAFASLVAAEPAAEIPTPPEWLVDFGMGIIQSLITDNGDVIQCLAVGAEPLATNALAAGQEFVEAVKTHNETLLIKAAKDTVDTCAGLEPMLEVCDDAHTDVMGILDVLKQIHGPMDFVKHIGDDLKNDMDHIFDAAGKAFKAFSEKDWSNFGIYLGEFLHRLVVGKYPDEQGRRLGEGQDLPPIADLLAFGVPFVSAILSDKPDFMQCAFSGLPIIEGLQNFAKDFKRALDDHNMTALTQSVKDVSGACSGAAGIKDACAPVGEDVQEIVRVMKTIDNIAGLLNHIVDNLEENLDKIEDNMDEAIKAFGKEPRDLSTMGDNLGKALHRLIIEKYPDDTAVIV